MAFWYSPCRLFDKSQSLNSELPNQPDDHSSLIKRRVHDVVLTDPTFDRLTVTFGKSANSVSAAQQWEKLVVRLVQIKGEVRWQFSYFTAKQDITKNYLASEATEALTAALNLPIRAASVQNAAELWSVQIGKRGTPILHHQARETSPAKPDDRTQHDRVKHMLIPARHPDPLLYAIGIADADGRIRPSMRRQVCTGQQLREPARISKWTRWAT